MKAFISITSLLRQPFLSASHLAGAIGGVAATTALLCSCPIDSLKFYAFCLYGITLIFLFSASALYHGIHHRCDSTELFFEKLDYAGIYLFIAGTYTPVCLYSLNRSLGMPLLIIQWISAFAGAYSVIRWGFARKTFQVSIFLFMGWTFLFVCNSLLNALPADTEFYLFLGALAYSVGALVFLFAPKRIWSQRICTHAVWHVFVLVGASAHFVMIKKIMAL